MVIAAPPRLDDATLRRAARELATRDDALAGILARLGPPPLWEREPGFETLAAIILEQQVSLRSGAAALARLRLAAGADRFGPLRPDSVVELGEAGAKAAGLTRQKARYVVALAASIVAGSFDPGALPALGDDAARAELVALLGVGHWTADIYLLMALGRADIWPDGDLALAAAMRRAKDLPALPDAEQQRRIADAWRPWRAVAARLLWHAYLAGER